MWLSRTTPSERRTLLAGFAGYGLDGFDAMIYTFVIPTLLSAWSMTKGEAGDIATSLLVTSAIGGWGAGVLADRNPPWLADLVERRLTARVPLGLSTWPLARWLVRLGAIERPAVPEYGAEMVQVLMQCGDELTRENVMKQAANIKNFSTDMMLPGIKVNTGPDDFFPIEQMQLMKFDGQSWQLFGDVISGEVGH